LTVTRSNSNDFERLKRLWEARSDNGAARDFPIGPGDVLEISVPAIPELSTRVERVSGEGEISLPYIGEIKAAGMTDEELEGELHQRLLKYMHNPRVFLMVKEYHSRQVAVLGAVMQPGMYTLNSESDTMADLVTRAGGVTMNADPVIQIIPAEEVSKEEKVKFMAVASTLPQNGDNQRATPLILKRIEPIVIDTDELARRGLQKYLYLPARPGDVIMVPGGAQVLVEGWVEKPGAYPVSTGLTLTGVIAAAGGPSYPADMGRVRIIRPEKDGTKTVAVVNVDEIKSGKEQDIRLQGGDIIEVRGVDSKLVGYGFFRTFTTMFNVATKIF
jgi:polysaccharide biosynthesis/export protein